MLAELGLYSTDLLVSLLSRESFNLPPPPPAPSIALKPPSRCSSFGPTYPPKLDHKTPLYAPVSSQRLLTLTPLSLLFPFPGEPSLSVSGINTLLFSTCNLGLLLLCLPPSYLYFCAFCLLPWTMSTSRCTVAPTRHLLMVGLSSLQ